MTESTDSDPGLYRRGDLPILVLSQDYELFFQQSGSIEKCLIEPADQLADFAETRRIRITFFVDAGMLCRMQQLSQVDAGIGKDLSRIQRHIASLYDRGHEIGLHIHPHWEDTRWTRETWDFSDTRYQLQQFSEVEVADIVSRYTLALKELCNGEVTSFRAGGFCIEPFDILRDSLLANGITADSSVVPGAVLKDKDKGFDFSSAPDTPWWRFSVSPCAPDLSGEFLEIPLTPLQLPAWHYWGRALDKLLKRQPAAVIGDGLSKAIGRREIMRRLVGAGRVSELSIDVPKSPHLVSPQVARQHREVWQVMGHPKLFGKPSLEKLDKFIACKKFRRFESITGLAIAIRAGELSSRAA